MNSVDLIVEPGAGGGKKGAALAGICLGGSRGEVGLDIVLAASRATGVAGIVLARTPTAEAGMLVTVDRAVRDKKWVVFLGWEPHPMNITIDMKSVNTGFADFNGHIQGEDFLDTAKFPTATFKSTKVVFEGDKPKAIEGNLTIKGVTKPVTLTVTSFQAMPHPMMKKPALGANAFTTIKRTEFNAGKYAPYVGDEVRIDIAIEAIQQ